MAAVPALAAAEPDLRLADGEHGTGQSLRQGSEAGTATGPALSLTEKLIWKALQGADVVPYDTLLRAMYGGKAWGPRERSVLKAMVYRLRKKGVSVWSIRGEGYHLASSACPTCGR